MRSLITAATAVACLAATPAAAQKIADKYVGDKGIAADPAVVFTDNFEQGLSATKAKWTAAGGGTKITVVKDAPAASGGSNALRLQGPGSGSSLYKRLSKNHAQLYLRYYVKYGGTKYHHTGGYLGGYEPPTNWPMGDAGLKGVRSNGDLLLNVGFETMGSSTPQRLDFYMNWIDMQGPPWQGLYYGRTMLQAEKLPIKPNTWRCVEVMVKLNSATTKMDGELAIWLDGKAIHHFKPGSPKGAWDGSGNWKTGSSGQGFPGFMWRNSLKLGLNWVKVQNYDATPDARFDDLVAATKRIGCIATGPPPKLDGGVTKKDSGPTKQDTGVSKKDTGGAPDTGGVQDAKTGSEGGASVDSAPAGDGAAARDSNGGTRGDDGCSCRLGSSRLGPPLFLAGLLALLLIHRRRR